MIRNMAIGMIAAVFVSVLLGGCEQSASTSIKIGINPWPGYEFLYLAQEQGFYEEQGVSVDIVEYGSLSDVRRGYERGNLDAMASTLVEVLQVKNNSTRNPQIFLIADFSSGGDVIIAQHPIRTPADLKGKRVGADTTSLPLFVLARALESSGLTLSDVEVVPLEQSDMEQAYVRGEIDVAVTYPPVSVRLRSRDDSNVIFTTKAIPGEVVDVVSVEASVLEERPRDIRKILLAWDQALRYAGANPQQANEIMAKREGITAAEFAGALEELEIVSLADQSRYFPLLKPTLAKVREVLVETGALSPNVSADCCVPESLH